ncbi:MAG: SDR family oxidoreductase [Turneriella sp.]
MKSFKGKVAVVTGGAAGIGKSLVLELARRGAHVAFNDIADMSSTVSAISDAGVRFYNEKTDMSDKAQIKAFSENVLREFGHIDVLINNAGIALGDTTFDEVTVEELEKITNINYWGVIYTTKLFYKTLLSSPEAAVANLSSSQGILPLPFLIPYCTTKFAVRGFSDTLRTEHKVRGIDNVTVHTVHPGAVATNITVNADRHNSNTEFFHQMLQKQGTTPDEAANIILDGIAKNNPRIFINNGGVQDVLQRITPEHSADLVSLGMRLAGVKPR